MLKTLLPEGRAGSKYFYTIMLKKVTEYTLIVKKGKNSFYTYLERNKYFFYSISSMRRRVSR